MRSAWQWAMWLGLTAAAGAVACADALRLEPPGGGSGGGASGTGGGPSCRSNSDCAAPTGVCDTIKHTCVQCLVLEDCGAQPGTVCSKGQCACPIKGQSWCAPNQCVDLTSASDNCGQCGHACFGGCSMSACLDPWEPVASANAPSARYQHVAVWTGSVMVVWGGTSNGAGSGARSDGGIYDPKTFTWTSTSKAGAPTPRYLATAVWTGKQMLVWGGRDTQDRPLGDGASFDPATNSWKPMASANAPSPRYHHTAVWSGSEMFLWGGIDPSGNTLGNGGRYNPMADSWDVVGPGGMVPAHTAAEHAALWDPKANRMVIYGGHGDDSADSVKNQFWPFAPVLGGYRYDPMANSWDALNQAGQPGGRSNLAFVFDGTDYFVYGGHDAGSTFGDGALYVPPGAWAPLNGPAPQPRSSNAPMCALWLDGPKRIVVWGGMGSNGHPLADGAVYDPSMGKNTWEKMIPTALSARVDHTCVSTGDKLIVWGGQADGGAPLGDGGLYKP